MSLVNSTTCFVTPNICKWIDRGYGRYGIIVSSNKFEEDAKPFIRSQIDERDKIARKGCHYTSNLTFYDFNPPKVKIFDIFKCTLGNFCVEIIKKFSMFSNTYFIVGDSKGSINLYKM